MKRKPKTKSSHDVFKARLIFVSTLFFLFGVALVGRLFHLQILQHESLVARSEKQYLSTVNIHFGRGTIFDRNRNELARNIQVESVYVTPSEITNKNETARQIASALRITPGSVFKKITSGRHFVWIKRKCNPAEVEKLRQLHLPGVGFVSEHKRFYPKRGLASDVIGFVGVDNQGLAGVEHYRHSLLKGKTIRKVMEKDARGRFVRSFHVNDESTPVSHDVVLTLDEVIQFTAEYELQKQVKKYRAKAGLAVVMDPNTGEIYALANVPRYNPNNYGAYPPALWVNQVVTHSYEPGSIFKPIAAAAAIDMKAARPNDIFFCENGKFQVGRTRIGEASDHKFGWLTLQNIIAKSSNIGAIKIAQQLGQKPFHDYIRKFGFGEKTGVDLPAESPGQLKSVAQWSQLSLASISFGHEIGVTPLQMVTSLGAIANGGNLMKPTITRAILKDGQTVKSFSPQVVRRVISKKASRQMVDILKSVVKDGTGTKASIEGFEVAGKTGTAQKFDPETQTYSKSAFISSFIGFAPADAARLVILVMIDEPQGTYWGGVVAAPVFREISRKALRYLNIPSSNERVYILDHV